MSAGCQRCQHPYYHGSSALIRGHGQEVAPVGHRADRIAGRQAKETPSWRQTWVMLVLGETGSCHHAGLSGASLCPSLHFSWKKGTTWWACHVPSVFPLILVPFVEVKTQESSPLCCSEVPSKSPPLSISISVTSPIITTISPNPHYPFSCAVYSSSSSPFSLSCATFATD